MHGHSVPSTGALAAKRYGGNLFQAVQRSDFSVPGSKNWILGLANIRGQLLPVIDLKAFLGGPATRPGRDTRIIWVNHRDVPAGLVVDEVLGFRRFPGDQRGQNVPEMVLRCERYLRGAFRHDVETWPVFDLAGLVQSAQFLKAGRQSA